MLSSAWTRSRRGDGPERSAAATTRPSSGTPGRAPDGVPMRRLLASALVLGTLIAGALLTAPPARADAPVPAVSPSTIPRDGTFTVSGSGCLDPMYNPYTH